MALQVAPLLERPRPAVRETYLMVGNPGVGKSTILNGALGEAMFLSGVEFGTGMTYQLHTYTDEHYGVAYTDTPGLADTAKCQQAAVAITRALQVGGRFRIFFVVQVRQGRVLPEDAATMKLVLDAAPITSYGVIINQVTDREYDELVHNPRGASPSPMDVVLRQLMATLKSEQRTLSVHIMRRDPDLDGADNIVKQLPIDLVEFMASLPPTTIAPDDVSRVRADKFEKERDEATQRLAEVHQENCTLQEAWRMTAAELHQLQQQNAEHLHAMRVLQAQLQERGVVDDLAIRELRRQFDWLLRQCDGLLEEQEAAHYKTNELVVPLPP